MRRRRRRPESGTQNAVWKLNCFYIFTRVRCILSSIIIIIITPRDRVHDEHAPRIMSFNLIKIMHTTREMKIIRFFFLARLKFKI